MKTFSVTIQELTPVLINRFKENDEIITELAKNTTKKDKYGTPREQAEAAAYADAKTKRCWVPSTWISGCLRDVASDYKLKGSGSGRRTLKSVVAGAVRPAEEKIYFDEKYCLKHGEVDSRPVVVNRARIMRHRLRFEEWTLSFTLEIDESVVDPKEVKQVLEDAGNRVGIGDFRVNRSGPFGRFHVISWKELKSCVAAKAPRKVKTVK